MNFFKHILIFIYIIYLAAAFTACSDGIMGKSLDSPVTNNLKEDTDDKSAPEIPDDGLIDVTSITANSLILSWPAASDTVTAQLNLAYAVYLSPDNSEKTISEWESETTVQDYTTGSLSVTAEKLLPNTTYYFNVIVRDSAGNKALYRMNESATTEIEDKTAPVPGDGGKITSSSITGSSLILNWTESTDNITEPADLRYAVYQSGSDNISTAEGFEGNGNRIQDYTPGLTKKEITALSPGKSYYFTVIVKDSAENKAVYILKDQKTGNVIDSTPPVPGNNGIITTSIVNSDSITLNWTEGNDDSTITGDLQYAVYESLSDNINTAVDCKNYGTLIQDYTPNLTAIWITGLLVNVTYYFNVVVKDSAGNQSVYAVTKESTGNNYVKLSFHARNSILHGKEIFDAVMKKYKIVADSYEAGLFAKVVNTNLLNDASIPVIPEWKMFNYELLSAYGDIEIVAQYDDGITQALPRSELLAANGNPGYDTELNRNGKKIVNFLVKREDADTIKNNVLGQLANKLQNSCKYTEFSFSPDLQRISSYTAAVEEMQNLSSTLANIDQTAGYISLALDVLQMTGVNSKVQDDAQINEKLGYIISIIDVIYQNIETIESRLNEIQDTIVNKAGKQKQLDFTALVSDIKSKLSAIKIAQSITTRKIAASQYVVPVDGYLLNYTDLSEMDWKNFIDYKLNVEKTDLTYFPLRIRIEIPHRRYYTDGTTKRIECELTCFTITNSRSYIPFTNEGLWYLKNLYTTRFGLNSIMETDEKDLNNANSAAAVIYLNEPGSYIGKLRTDILNSYNSVSNELVKTSNCINWPTQTCIIDPMNSIWGGWDYEKKRTTSRSGPCTVKDNLLFITQYLAQPVGIEGINIEYLCCDTSIGGGIFYTYEGLFGGKDLFDWTPYFSFAPYSFTPWLGISPTTRWTKNDFPYPPTFIVGWFFTGTINIDRSVQDVTFLDNVVDLMNIYYYGNSGKLLEFAASLAALEIQTALYLDPDSQDYRDYISAP